MKKLVVLLTLQLSGWALAQPTAKTIQLLPDTGQTISYTTTFGEDNDYAINPPNYTNNGDGTITDTVTGLMWQQGDGGEMTIENATTYCDNLNLGGYTNWRLPSPMEAFSILNQQNVNPAINTTYFTSTAAEYWWTNAFQANDVTKVWVTNAGGGIGNHPKAETVSAGGTKNFHVRAVRDLATPTTIPNRFTDNGDGTVTDNLTQLIWQQVPNATAVPWEQALGYAENLILSGHDDWRLPNIKELQSLNNETYTNPSVHPTFFSGLGVHNYWSSTTLKPNLSNPNGAWYWNTQFGITTYDVKTNSNYVLCVRGVPTALSTHQLTDLSKALTVFPNPFTSKITLSSTTNPVYCELYATSGQLLYAGKAIDKQDFSGLSKGTYTLKIAGDTTTTVKLIKE